MNRNSKRASLAAAGLLALTVSDTVGAAQGGRPILAVFPLSTAQNSDAYRFVEKGVREAVTNTFENSKRFSLVDRSKLNHVFEEKNIQKNEEFLSSAHVAEQGKLLGAELVLTGNIDNVTVEGRHASSSTNYYASVVVGIRVIDVETGAVTASHQMTLSSGAGGARGFFGAMVSFANSAEDALRQALNRVPTELDPFIKANFPLLLRLVEVSEAKDDAAIRVLLAGGSGVALKPNDRLKVIEQNTIEVDGKPLVRKKDVGELVVEQVEDENFSICAVKSGGSPIQQKMTAKNKLYATPIAVQK